MIYNLVTLWTYSFFSPSFFSPSFLFESSVLPSDSLFCRWAGWLVRLCHIDFRNPSFWWSSAVVEALPLLL